MTNKAKEKRTGIEISEAPSPYSPTQIKNFFNEVKIEFGKIVWPDKKMTIGLAGIVVVMTVVISMYLGAIDLVIGKMVSGFLR